MGAFTWEKVDGMDLGNRVIIAERRFSSQGVFGFAVHLQPTEAGVRF